MKKKIIDFIELRRMLHQVYLVMAKTRIQQYYHAIVHDSYLIILKVFFPSEIRKTKELFKDEE
jgi:hypothetical protein